MKFDFQKITDDINNLDLPSNVDNYNKIHCELKTGKRIYWYYKEDLEFFEEIEEDIKESKTQVFTGVVIPIPDYEERGGELDADQCIVCMDGYPTEKEYPSVDWFSIKRLLDDESLIEIFE